MGNLIYLFAAFAVIWLAVLLYSYSIGARQKGLEREIEMLRAIVAGREGEAPSL